MCNEAVMMKSSQLYVPARFTNDPNSVRRGSFIYTLSIVVYILPLRSRSFEKTEDSFLRLNWSREDEAECDSFGPASFRTRLPPFGNGLLNRSLRIISLQGKEI